MGGPQRNHPVRPPGPQRRQEPSPPQVQTVTYFDDKGNLREELVDEEAEEQAKTLAGAGLKHTQLRRYYEDVLNLRRRLDHEIANRPGATEEEVFLKLRPEFKMLRAKAYYANERSDKIFPDAFKTFIEINVKSVRNAADFKAFCQYFQAVVAFHRVYAKD